MNCVQITIRYFLLRFRTFWHRYTSDGKKCYCPLNESPIKLVSAKKSESLGIYPAINSSRTAVVHIESYILPPLLSQIGCNFLTVYSVTHVSILSPYTECFHNNIRNTHSCVYYSVANLKFLYKKFLI